MADAHLERKVKGILKTHVDVQNENSNRKEMKWDEMNIVATHHPEDKDYGHMKIEEPKTPYSKYEDPEDNESQDSNEVLKRRSSVEAVNEEDDVDSLDPQSLADRLKNPSPRQMSCDDESDDDEVYYTEEEKAKRKSFEQKRKMHYNEFQAIKLAKQLLAQEEEEDEEGDDNTDVGANEQDMLQDCKDSGKTGTMK